MGETTGQPNPRDASGDTRTELPPRAIPGPRRIAQGFANFLSHAAAVPLGAALQARRHFVP
jgi:hypothetical protein